MVKAEPDFDPIVQRWQEEFDKYPEKLNEFRQTLADYETQAAEREGAGLPVQKLPDIPRDPRAHPHRVSGLYNAMINPLIPFSIAGAIWYQGESNAGRAYQYRSIFPAMIRSWRDAWGQGDFPFYFVQLANFMARKEQPEDSAWAELREAQTLSLDLPNTGMAVAIDIGEAEDIHPRNKQDVGWRLALWALGEAYNRNIMVSGPLYKSMKKEGNKIRIDFNHAGESLHSKGEGGLKGFQIAGEDKQFVWANAAIEDQTVVVWSDQVAEPVAVRYAWADNPEANLYNNAELPASPFRTDDWPGKTVDEK
jgi:sialate O-acetylesterase